MIETTTEPLYACSRVQLAAMLGVTERTVGRWLSDGAPKKAKRGYNLREWFAWWAANTGQTPDADGGTSAREADRRWKNARASREERKNQLEAGEVITMDEHKKSRMAVVDCFVGMCDSAGAELSTMLIGKGPQEVRRIVDRYWKDRRRELIEAQP